MNWNENMKYELLLLNIERIPTQMFDNLGQHAIAAYLETKEFQAKIYSGTAGMCKGVIQTAIEQDCVPVIGFYAATDNTPLVTHIIQWIKQNYEVYILVGSPEAVALKEGFLLHTGCDFIIEGEGEIPVYQLLSSLLDDAIPLTHVQSLRYIDSSGTYRENPLAPLIENLDILPFPSRKRCLDRNFRRGSSFGVITGRGCPFHCVFCYEGANTKRVRLRSIENVMGEIDLALSENPGLRYLNVYDDTFTLDFNRVREFCREVKKRNLFWYCEGHVSNIVKHPEIVKEMVDAGMIGLQIGIESGSDRVLKAYNKHITAEMLLEVVRICHASGLVRLVGNFIIGGAFETEETVRQSMLLAERMMEEGTGMFECKTVFLAPYPETPITKNPEDYDLEYREGEEISCLYSMHMPLMNAKAIATERLILLKKEFDQMILDKVTSLSFHASKDRLELNFYRCNQHLQSASIWKDRYSQHPHLVNFLEGTHSEDGTRYPEPQELKHCYPVRMFYLLKYDGGHLTYGDYQFSKIEGEFLRYAAGKMTFTEISAKTGYSLQELEQVYYKLNESCLVYASEF